MASPKQNLGQAASCTGATRWCPTIHASGPPSRPTRSRWGTGRSRIPSVFVRFPVADAHEHLVPRVDHHSVDPPLESRAGRASRRWTTPLSGQCRRDAGARRRAGRTRCCATLRVRPIEKSGQGRGAGRHAIHGASSISFPPRGRSAGCCDGRLRDHRRRHRGGALRTRLRRGRRPKLCQAHGPPGGARRGARRQVPAGGRPRSRGSSSRTPTRCSWRSSGERGLLYRAETCTCTTTRTGGAPAIPLIYYAKHAWYIAHFVRMRDRLVDLNRHHQLGAGERSGTGDSATGSRTTSTGRCRENASGALRCRCGPTAKETSSVSVRRRSWKTLCGRTLHGPRSAPSRHRRR